MVSFEDGISARRLAQILGGSYKTAWFLEHRIRAAMSAHRESPSFPTAYVASTDGAWGARGREVEPGEGGVAAPSGWRLLRKLIAGSHANLSGKYLSAYWGELRWRDANRGNPSVFRDTVAALLRHPSLTYEQLVTNSAGVGRGVA
jgi:hypothetical protein